MSQTEKFVVGAKRAYGAKAQLQT